MALGRFVNLSLRFLQILGGVCALAITSYLFFRVTQADHNLTGQALAVEIISGVGLIYAFIFFFLGLCLFKQTFFQILTIVVDFLFIGAFTAVAILVKDGATQQCDGRRTIPGPQWLGEGTGSVVTNCKLIEVIFATAVGLAGLFLLSLLFSLFTFRTARKERAFGPSPSNNYTSGLRHNKSATTGLPRRSAESTRSENKEIVNIPILPINSTPAREYGHYPAQAPTQSNIPPSRVTSLPLPSANTSTAFVQTPYSRAGMVSDLDMMAGRDVLAQHGQTQGRVDNDPVYQPRQYQSQSQTQLQPQQRSQSASRTVSQNYGQAQNQNQYGTVNSERMIANTHTNTHTHTNNVIQPTSFLPLNVDGNTDDAYNGHQATTAVEMDAAGPMNRAEPTYRVAQGSQRQTVELDSTPVTLMPEGTHFYGTNVGQVHRRSELDASGGTRHTGVGGNGEVRQIYQEVDDDGSRGRIV